MAGKVQKYKNLRVKIVFKKRLKIPQVFLEVYSEGKSGLINSDWHVLKFSGYRLEPDNIGKFYILTSYSNFEKMLIIVAIPKLHLVLSIILLIGWFFENKTWHLKSVIFCLRCLIWPVPLIVHLPCSSLFRSISKVLHWPILKLDLSPWNFIYIIFCVF